jgi:hypothetical protein
MVMLRSMLQWPSLICLLLALIAAVLKPTQAAISEERQLAIIQELIRNSRFSDTVDKLSQLPQVQQHALDRIRERQKFRSEVSLPDSFIRNSAFQYLHQLCLDAAEHLAPHVIHSCFEYIVQQDEEQSAR